MQRQGAVSGWVQNGVDFSKSRNLITVAVALTLGAGNFVLNIGSFSIILYQILRERGTEPEEAATADAAVNIEPDGGGELEAGAGSRVEMG